MSRQEFSGPDPRQSSSQESLEILRTRNEVLQICSSRLRRQTFLMAAILPPRKMNPYIAFHMVQSVCRFLVTDESKV